MKRHLKINTIQEDLQKQLQALSPNKFLGRDGIHPKQAEGTASVISESVEILLMNHLKRKITISMARTFSCRNLQEYMT